MKRCPKCSIRYSEMWNICIVCKTPLVKEKILGKIFTKTRQSAKYLFPLIERSIEQANVLFLYLDKNLRPVMCNKAIEYISGYSREEISKGDWLELLFEGHPSRKEIFKAVINSCLASIESRPYEGAITKRDGSECILSWRNATVVDASGNISGILCIAQDITEYKKSENNVAVQSERLRDIFASIKDYALITTNLEDKITYYGIGSVGLFEWKADVTLKDISIIFTEPDRDNIIKKIKESIRMYGRVEEEVRLLRGVREVFPAVLTVSALLNKENKRTGYVYIVRDITERKKIESQMVQSEKLAAIGQLAAGVAHEINNPLLVILGRLDMLSMEDEKLTPTLMRTIETIRTQAKRMRIIVDRLLSYSRRRASRMDIVDINAVLKTVSPLVTYYPEFKKIVWKEKVTEGLPKIKGDFNQLQELFLNIALNACQAMPEGGVITISSKDTKDGFIEVAVKDAGVGIKKEDLGKLFTPFFTTKDNGTGLGLAICRSIVDSHGGKIEVETQPDKGSIFRIRLPVNNKE